MNANLVLILNKHININFEKNLFNRYSQVYLTSLFEFFTFKQEDLNVRFTVKILYKEFKSFNLFLLVIFL